MKHILPLCLLLLSTCVFAQTKTISGKVTDATTHEVMPGATVLVKGTHTGTGTDSTGRFKLEVPADAKTLTISFIGYLTKDVAITDGPIKVSMESTDVMGKEVVVSSSRTAEAIQEAPMQIEKMTSREIQSAASGDFYQSIGNYKGVDIVTTSAFFKVINLRGFDDTRSLRTKQYIDGVDNEAPGLNFPIGNMVGSNDLDLENVEVVSGAASSLYGANAMQGVISMTSKNPYDFQGVSFQIKAGASTVPGPYFDAQFRYASTLDKKNKLAFKITGEYTQLKDWPATNDSINHYGAISANANIDSALQSQAREPYCPTCPVTTAQHNNANALLGWLQFNTEASSFDASENRLGFLHIQAPGYAETSLADNNAQNIKFSTGLYYKLTNDLEFSAEYKFGYGTAVYQATTRYQIKDFFFHQPSLKLQGKNFFIRAYTSLENAGQSYNLEVTGDYLSAAAAPAYVNAFTTAYFNTINTLVGGFANCAQCFTGTDPIGPYGLTPVQILDSARNVGRRAAASAWLVPGTQAFIDTFNRIITDKNSLTGTQFYDRSALVNLDGQYNWDFVKWIDIITGASYRIYIPNSEGTILADTNGVTIREQEIGAYLQATKKLFHDNFKIIGSVRVDKNSNFNAQVSPRLSLVYTAKGKHSVNTLRASVTSAFRDPTLQDQYLYLNLGQIILVGNENGMSNLYTLSSVNNALSLLSQTQGGSNAAAAEAALVPIKLNPVRPEHLTSFDFGYRTEIANRVYIDLSAYYSLYNDFIGFTRVVAPNSSTTTNGVAGEQSGADNIIGGYYQPIQTWVNSLGKVPSWGAAASIAYYVGHGITPYVNYTYTDINDKNLSSDSLTILSGFNTPKHKINIGIQANRVWKGLGFTLNWKWVTSYEWDSPFANGTVPSFNTLDAQISYEIEKAYSTVRIGGSNIYNNMHIEAVGAPQIGALYYVGWMFDFNKLHKKNQIQ